LATSGRSELAAVPPGAPSASGAPGAARRARFQDCHGFGTGLRL